MAKEFDESVIFRRLSDIIESTEDTVDEAWLYSKERVDPYVEDETHGTPHIQDASIPLQLMYFDYCKYTMAQSIRTTPRGAQDKQLLALTRCELPWTPADYKTRSNANKPVSIVWDLLGDTPTICKR